jgi:hemolysin activation/secretion protein
LCEERVRRVIVCVAAVIVLGPCRAFAQTRPDAGTVLQQIEKQQQKPLPPKGETEFAAPAPMQSMGAQTVIVKSFRFAGNTLLTNSQLAPAVANFLNRPVSFTDLQNAAIAVADAYRKAGWVVRAYLPQQDITDATVAIQIIEGRFGSVHVEGQSKRVSDARIQRIVEAAQPVGTPVNADALDRALLLINDLPGVSAKGRLSEGQNQAQTDLVVEETAGPLITGSLTGDNTGARYTGADRAILSASLNDRLGIGDRADAVVLHTDGSDYQRLAYSIAAGSRGLRLGLNASHLAYDIVTPESSSLDAHGTSTTGGLEASYPIVRSRLRNLYLALNLDDRRFDNYSGGEATTRYSVRGATLSLYGDSFDSLGGGGTNTANVTLERGNLDLSGSPNESADALTTRSAGSFEKLHLLVSRLQGVTAHFSLYGSLSGQLASKNLDSSEKIYLGGSDGVRAYPANEGGGSEGVLLSLETRESLPLNFDLAEFFDWGRVRFNKSNQFPGAASPNSDELKGVGLSAGWVARFGLTLKATYAHRIGSNPDPTSTGNDQDGSLVKNRFWLLASMPF